LGRKYGDKKEAKISEMVQNHSFRAISSSAVCLASGGHICGYTFIQ
jgi:hypothetical protein